MRLYEYEYAARWSTEAEIIVDEDGQLTRLSEDIERLLETLTPIAKRLGSREELNRIRDIMRIGPSYQRQRAVLHETGSMEAVVDMLVTELRENRPASA